MKKALIIIGVLPFLFAGSTGQNQRGGPASGMDTVMVSRIAQRLADQWAMKQAAVIDSTFSEDLIGRIDVEERPDGSAYAWVWHYRVAGEDTTFLRTVVKKD